MLMTTDPKTGQEIVLVLQGGGALGATQAETINADPLAFALS
jgi:predicted acylesterase/phospholipase RssA